MIGLYCARHDITMVSKVGYTYEWISIVTTGIAAVPLISRALSFVIIIIISSSIVRPTGCMSYITFVWLWPYKM